MCSRVWDSLPPNPANATQITGGHFKSCTHVYISACLVDNVSEGGGEQSEAYIPLYLVHDVEGACSGIVFDCQEGLFAGRHNIF
jgi:hypothetical protein